MTLALETISLVKVYRGGVKALDNLSSQVSLGSLYCIAGPNGAGKTTFIRISSTIIKPTSGRVHVMGYDALKEPWKVRRLISVMPQEGEPFNSTLTVEESIYYYLLSRGFSRATAKRETRSVLEDLDLLNYRNKLIINLSGGLKRRALLAMVLASNTDVVFLDEPTVGLDPVSRRITWGYIKRLSKEGQTIIFTTHLLSEAESLADTILLINKGRKYFEGKPIDALGKLGYRYKVITETSKVPDWIEEEYKVRFYGDLAYIYLDDLPSALKIAEEILYEGGQAQIKPVDLEDYFSEVVESV